MNSENGSNSAAGTDLNLRIGQLAIRNEFLNLSELKHCVAVREKLLKKGHRIDDFGEVLVKERYLTPENLEYLLMIDSAEPVDAPVRLEDIEEEFRQQVAEIKKGATFAHFEILGELGRGGMGVVLLAQDKNRDEKVALKILIGGDKATVRDIERFKKEATVMMPLLHHGIVRIYDVGRIKGLDFISMEFIDGKSLKELAKGPTPIDAVEALRIIRSASEAVGFIHGHSIIHRDIKPENIMVRDEDGSAVLMDFGLAGWDKIEVLAGRGSIGTPMYQPPEQAEVGGPFGKISFASDVYGLGATLYYLLTGHHPFTGRSVKEVREKIKRVPPTPPSSKRADLPEVAEALILRCMKKKQSERFATPKEFIDAIDQVLKVLGASPQAPAAKPDSKRNPRARKLARNTGKSPRVNKQRVTGRRRQTGAAPAVTGLNRRATDKHRRTGELAASRSAAWYENPIVLIVGTILTLGLLAAVGALLIN